MHLLKCFFFSSVFSSTHVPPPIPLSLFFLLAAMAPLVNGAAIYRWRRAWRGVSGAFGWGQWPWWIGWVAHRRLGPGRVRRKHGGSTRLWGTLGTRSPPSAQPEEVPGQRRQQAGPLACCGRVGGCAAQAPPPLSSHAYLIFVCSAYQNCAAVSDQPFCQLWSSRLASLLVVRWHISLTPLLLFFQIKSCFSLSRPFARTGMLHSNPGDYAWGQGGLDAVITQVCET